MYLNLSDPLRSTSPGTIRHSLSLCEVSRADSALEKLIKLFEGPALELWHEEVHEDTEQERGASIDES